MVIRSQNFFPPTPRALPRTQPLSSEPGESYSQVQRDHSKLGRYAVVGGVSAAAGAALSLAAGMRFGQALGLVVPMTLLGLVGASLYSAQPNVALTPQLDQFLQGRFHDVQKQAVQKALNALGPENTQKLIDGGIHLVVDGDRVPDKAAAVFIATEKLVAFKRSETTKGITIHELGHALDHLALPNEAKGKAYFRSQVDTELLANFKGYEERINNPEQPMRRSRWSDYARTNEREYLAEGVMFYLESDEKKAELQKKDPAHYAYIEKFLSKG